MWHDWQCDVFQFTGLRGGRMNLTHLILFRFFAGASGTVVAGPEIDGATTNVLATQYAKLRILCDGADWHIVSD
jgi:hypothetical protein